MKTRIFEEPAARRVLIILNALLSFLFIISFEFKEIVNEFDPLFILRGLNLAIVIITYLAVYRRRGLWSFAHKDIASMDEREKILAGNAVRKAYSLFVIPTVALLMVYALTDRTIHIIVTSFLLYAAHILPSAVLAWDDYKYETE